MRHSVRMSTIVRVKGKEESKLIVFEVEDFENLEQELKRRTRIYVNEGGRVVDQTITMSKMK